MKLYRGYFGLNGKTPLMKWGRENASDEELLTLKQAQGYKDYGAALTEETALVDIDESGQAEKLFAIVKAEGLKCRVVKTDRGMHFLFANKRKGLSKCGAKLRFAVGLSGDVKVGITNSYEKLKSHGVERPCIYGQTFADTDDLDEVPIWLHVIGDASKTTDYPSMASGDGRNDALYKLSFNLQKRGFSAEQVTTTCRLLNDYVFEEPLDESELRLVSREESLKVGSTYDDGYDEEADAGGTDLQAMLERNEKTGAVLPSIRNIETIIRETPCFAGVRKDLLADVIEAGSSLPWKRDERQKEWTDDDDGRLQAYLERYCRQFKKADIFTGLNNVANDRAYHPVKDYLESLPAWDGMERADRLFVTFLGAEDSEYVRQVTRKTLVAAVKRVYDPGCQFDTLLVLNGGQGIGKSTLIHLLAGKWFGDSLLLSDILYNGKSAVEKIQGVWIEEIAELSGLKKVDVESLRGFITRRDDYGRAAYARRSVHRDRQCILFGTTNAQGDGFLRDTDGNRRFLIIDTYGEKRKRTCVGEKADLDQKEIDQVWAEIMVRYKAGEDIYLTDPEVLAEAERIQNRSMEENPLQPTIEKYLARKLPDDWYSRSEESRVNFFKFDDGDEAGCYRTRQYVTYMELWTEALGKDARAITTIDKNNLKAIMIRIGWVAPHKAMRLGRLNTKAFERKELTDKGFK